MRLTRRRSAGPDDSSAPSTPPPPRPPRGAAVCAYAGVLDGVTLWLAVETRPGTLALRDTATGEVSPLVSDLVDDPTEHRSVRADVSTMLAPSYDVVLVPPGGGSPVPVWSAPLPDVGPVRVPPAPDGALRSLRRDPEGTLQLHRSEPETGVLLDRIELVDEAIVLYLRDAVGELALVAELDDATVLRVPVTDGRAVLAVGDLTDGGDLMTRAVVEGPDGPLPVRRRDNDLANPGHAALLPMLTDADGRPLLRPRWKPGGLLAVRLHPEEGSA